MMINIQTGAAPIIWQGKRTQRRRWLLTCDRLNLAVEAADESEVRDLVPECLHLFFLDHFEEGTLDALLRERGWSTDVPPARGDVELFIAPWSLTL